MVLVSKPPYSNTPPENTITRATAYLAELAHKLLLFTDAGLLTAVICGKYTTTAARGASPA